MEIKVFEIRDKATFIPACAIKMTSADEKESYLLRRAGFMSDDHVVLMRFHDDEAHYDPYAWANRRTLTNAHRYIVKYFDSLESGAVIDVEFILGETHDPKASERYFDPTR